MKLKFVIFIFNFSILFYNVKAQEQKPFFLGLNISRSFATSGDHYGLMNGVFLEKPIKKNRLLGVELAFNAHTEIPAEIYVNSITNPSEISDLSYRRVTSGLQLVVYSGKQFKISEKHFFRTDIGPVMRLQFNSNNAFEVLYPGLTNLPVPVIIFNNFNAMKRTSFSVGLKAALQYQYQVNDKWRIGLHGSIQSDTQGDNFYNYGLTVATRFFR